MCRFCMPQVRPSGAVRRSGSRADGIFGTGVIHRQADGSVLVALSVEEGTVPDIRNESWDAVVVRQGGAWKVCGFRQA
jgi:hypothetical protein